MPLLFELYMIEVIIVAIVFSFLSKK